ncbi:CDP-2,3-bis-(O-geranylgeranyl)-sn-glycerol synthase [Methanocaldococcus infernus]
MSGLHLLSEILNSLLYILPAYVANASACIFGGGKPLDLNKCWPDGRRLLGDGVTIKGSFFGILLGTLTGFIEGLFFNAPLLYLKLGFTLSLGAILGDAIGSFIKRRLNIERGKPAPLLDQLDFAIGALILGSLIKSIAIHQVFIILLITIFIHLFANILAYSLKIKDVWW